VPRVRRPVEDRLLDGTYKPSRHGPIPEPEDLGSIRPPVKPTDLTGPAAKIWEQLLSLLGGVARDRDGPLLADLCRWWAELKRVQKVLKTTEPGEKGYNQLLIAAGICSDKLDKIAARFGLTPADRAKLKAEQMGPLVTRVKTMPKTRLDAMGPPKGSP
jgi:phage terminase small subunit